MDPEHKTQHRDGDPSAEDGPPERVERPRPARPRLDRRDVIGISVRLVRHVEEFAEWACGSDGDRCVARAQLFVYGCVCIIGRTALA